jgi:hypothetical protein
MSLEGIIEKILIPLGATFAGAFLAFRSQSTIEKNKEKRAILQNLVVYRNVGAEELDWIKSVNAIDLVFHNNERVRQLFSLFYEIVCDEVRYGKSEHVDVYYEMLYEMAKDCGYDQMTVSEIKSKVYSPQALSRHYPPQHFAQSLGPPNSEMAKLLEEISQLGTA